MIWICLYYNYLSPCFKLQNSCGNSWRQIDPNTAVSDSFLFFILDLNWFPAWNSLHSWSKDYKVYVCLYQNFCANPVQSKCTKLGLVYIKFKTVYSTIWHDPKWKLGLLWSGVNILFSLVVSSIYSLFFNLIKRWGITIELFRMLSSINH